MFHPPIDRVIYSYKCDQDVFKEFDNDVEFVRGDNYTLNGNERSLLILDDQMQDRTLNISELFCVTSHHYNCSIMYVSHNLFHDDPKYRTAASNADYMILFKSPRGQGQIATLARQLYGCDKRRQTVLRTAYDDAVLRKPFGHLVVDMTPNCPECLRLRTDSLPHQGVPFMGYQMVKCYNCA